MLYNSIIRFYKSIKLRLHFKQMYNQKGITKVIIEILKFK